MKKGLTKGKSNFGMRKWKLFEPQLVILMNHYKVDTQSGAIRTLINEKLMQIENSKQIGG